MNFEDFNKEWNNSEDFITVKTSGSTGVPKTVCLPKTFVEQSALRTIGFFGLTTKSRFHSCVGADFIGGKMMAVRAWLLNAVFSWETPSNRPLKEIPKTESIDLLAIVPSQMLDILENLEKLPHISNIIIGGAPIPPHLKAKIADSGLNVYETYGMTETSSHIALRKITGEESPFKTLPGIRVSKDQRECIVVEFNNGQTVITNDVAELFSDKEFVIKGRCDNIIISGGKKINPFEIESKISRFISQDFFIGGVEDEKWGQKVVLFIEGHLSDEEIDKLKSDISEVLERWQKPKEIRCVTKLPRTPNGKIKR